MNKENLHKLECELRQNGYTRSIVNNSETTKEFNSYFWLKVFPKRDFNTNKDSIAYVIKYNITNKHAGNDVDESEVIVEIDNNFGHEGTVNTKISKSYISPKHVQIIAEEMCKCGNKYIINKNFIKYYWNMFTYWLLSNIDTILVAIACGVFFAITITSKN